MANLIRHTAEQKGLGYTPAYCPECIDKWSAKRIDMRHHMQHPRCREALEAIQRG